MHIRSFEVISFVHRSDGQEIAEPARHRRPRRPINPVSLISLHGLRSRTGKGLIITLKCVCLLKHIRDTILKGQILFSKRTRFSAGAFYWNNNPDKNHRNTQARARGKSLKEKASLS